MNPNQRRDAELAAMATPEGRMIRITALEAEVKRLRNFAAWVVGASDCRTDPIVEWINETARAVLAEKG